MNSAALYLLLLALTSFNYGNAEISDLDVADIGVDLISHLGSALEFQLSPDELTAWNATITEARLECIGETIKENLYTANSQCSVSVSESKISADEGSGWEDDAEGSAIPPEVLSRMFCNDACHSIFMLAYDSCGLFESDAGKEVKNVLGGLCATVKEKEVCLEVVTKFEPDSELLNCMTEEGCSRSCKLSAEKTITELGCCLRADGAFGSDVTKLLNGCGLQGSQGCKEMITEDLITNKAVATSINNIIILICAIAFLSL